MQKLFSLGELYVSDFLAPGQEPGQKHELEMVMDESIGAARLKTTIPVNKMFGKYWYRSGTNQSMTQALGDIVHSILPLVHNHKKDDIWCDIAANDGTLLSKVPKSFKRIGIDPCEDDIYESACKHGIIVKDYFSAEALYKARLFPPHAKVITCAAMFYDLEDPDEFLKDVYEVLDDEGLFVLQLSYTPLMLRQLAFDNILSEHVYYHTFGSMWKLLIRNGLRIVDCQLNDINGGSFRLFVRKDNANPKNFGTQAFRDVCEYRLGMMELYEADMEIDSLHVWTEFNKDILKLKAQVVEFITHAKGRGKTIMGYGASTKGNTLLQFFGLDHTLIDAIAERQECKWGLRTVGSNIPIISEEEMRRAQPDYLLVLPWHFISEMFEREKAWHDKGGKWIVPMPKFEIL